ncbi:unnamed protein product [Periconia digitata]|uniref:Rhodopsin domain-containing protein n=1 Tax=Periconia digitata TaxID=1303443 RepID=A0A9W4UCL2_9PLEO|nr:unnamed protein product [Periconia digitata]
MLDILTDLLIMAIPYMILRHVRLSTKQKLVLYSLFSLVIITIGVALTRVIVSMKARRQGGLTVSLLVFLADAEAATALFVACIGSFRTLFTQADTLTPYGSRNNQTPKAKPQNLGKQRSTGYSSNRNESSEAIVNATELRDMPPQSPQTPSAFYMKLELPGLGKT